MKPTWDLPRHLYVPALGGGAHAMLCVIAEQTARPGYGGYIASWHISEALPWSHDLDVVADNETPGNTAMRQLITLGLVEPVPDLGCRYRLTALGAALYFCYLANGIDVSVKES